MNSQCTPVFSHISEDLLLDPSNRRLLEMTDHFAKILTQLGYPVRAHSVSALEKLALIPEAKKEEITKNFENWSQWIEINNPNRSHDDEIALLRRALEKNGYEADEEFIKKIEKDQIIEFYNEDMIQLYRSFNFYKITGYSLLDISLFEWYVLWERPRQVLEGIAAELGKSLETYIPVKEFQTKRHVVREIFNSSKSENFQPRASLLTPVRLGSLKPRKFGSNQKKGFICTSTGEVLVIGKEAESISFI